MTGGSSQVHILYLLGTQETSQLICTTSCSIADFTLGSGLSARLIFHCRKHSSITVASYFFIVYLSGSYHSFSCEGAENKLGLADLPEVAYTTLLKENRQMEERNDSTFQNASFPKLLSGPYSFCLLWTVSSLRQELPIFRASCTVVSYVNIADPSSECDSGLIPH